MNVGALHSPVRYAHWNSTVALFNSTIKLFIYIWNGHSLGTFVSWWMQIVIEFGPWIILSVMCTWMKYIFCFCPLTVNRSRKACFHLYSQRVLVKLKLFFAVTQMRLVLTYLVLDASQVWKEIKILLKKLSNLPSFIAIQALIASQLTWIHHFIWS